MEFMTPFFFTYDDDLVSLELLKTNNFSVQSYALFCLHNEVMYWLTYNTTFINGELRLQSGPRPKPKISYGAKYAGCKLFITLLIEPYMDTETKEALQRFINETAELRPETPCLIMDSNLRIDDIDPQWMRDALDIVSCDLGTTMTDTAEVNDKYTVKSFTVHDKHTTRLYAMLNGDDIDVFQLDSRNFNQQYNYILTSVIEQLREMWKYGLVKGADIIATDWPLDALRDGWHKPKSGTILPRCMPYPSLFYTNIIAGNNIVRFNIPFNYAIMHYISTRLQDKLYTFRFVGSYLEVVVANYEQCSYINQVVEEALRTKNKVIEIVHPNVEQLNAVIVSINGMKVGLIPLANHEIGYNVREGILADLDNIIMPIKKD